MPDPDATRAYSARFTGSRFKADQGMPADALSEIVALNQVVKRMARLVHRGKGGKASAIDATFDLRVDGFSSGSKVADMRRLFDRPALPGMEAEDAYDHANDIIFAIGDWATGTEESLPELPHISPGLVVAALKVAAPLGRTLLDGEAMDYGVPNGRRTTCTRRTHQRVLQAATPGVVVADCVVIGQVVTQDFEKLSLKVKSAASTKQIPIDLIEPLEIDVLELLNQGQRTVVIRGSGFFVADGQLRSVTEPTDIVPLVGRGGTPMKTKVARFNANVREVEQRRAGWLEGTGLVPDPVALGQAVSLARDANQRYKTPYPIVGSTVDGGVTFDWVRSPWRLGGEIEPGSTTLELFAIDSDKATPATFRTIETTSLTAAGDLAEFIDWCPASQ